MEFLISNLIILNHTQKENAVLLALKDLLARLARLAPLVLSVFKDPKVIRVFKDPKVIRVFKDPKVIRVTKVQKVLDLVSHQGGIIRC